MNKVLTYSILIFALSLLLTSSVSAYQIDYFESSAGSPTNIDLTSFNSNQLCTVTVGSKGTFNSSSSYSTTFEYLSPNDTILSSSTANFDNPITCTNLGESVTTESFTGNIFEARIETTDTADVSSRYHARVKYQCTGDELELNFSLDSKNNIANILFAKDNTLGGVFEADLLAVKNFLNSSVFISLVEL